MNNTNLGFLSMVTSARDPDADKVIFKLILSMVLYGTRHVSRISLRETPQLRGAPRLGLEGPEARGPRVPTIKIKKSADLVNNILVWAR